MPDMIGLFAFDISSAIFALLFTVYLAYMIPRPEHLKSILSKQKKGTLSHYLYSRVYTFRFLLAWFFVTLFSVLNAGLGLYKSSRDPSAFVVNLGFLASMIVASVSLYLLWSALKKRKG